MLNVVHLLTKRKNETYHEYYLRTIDQYKKQRQSHKERYHNEVDYRRKFLRNQRQRMNKDRLEQNLKEIEELEKKWPVSKNPKDVVLKMTEREKMIMLTGLVLGEGSISMYRFNSQHSSQYHPVITFSNTDLDILDLFKSLFTETHLVKIKNDTHGNSQKNAYRLSIHAQKTVIKYLIMMCPFLVGRKLKIANLMIDVIKYRLTQLNQERGRMIVPDIEKKIAEIRKLNRRGREQY